MNKSERNALVLLVPGVVFYTVALQVAGRLSGTFYTQRAFYLQVYGVFIYTCCLWVVYKEYTNFFDVHERKDPAIDTGMLLMAALGMDCFMINCDDLSKALFGLVGFFSGACIWESYTMKVNRYFKTGNEPWTSWFRLLAEPRFPFRAPVETLHRDEYRYWLVLDGTVVVLLALVLAFFRSFLNNMPDFLLLIILVIFVAGQLHNVFRYRVVVQRVRSQETTEIGLAKGTARQDSAESDAGRTNMDETSLTKARGEIIEKAINIEMIVGAILSQHYLKRIVFPFITEVLGDEYFNFGLKVKILRKVFLDDTATLDQLARLNTIRNYFAHSGFQVSDKPDREADVRFLDMRKLGETVDFNKLYAEFISLEPNVAKFLFDKYKAMGGQSL